MQHNNTYHLWYSIKKHPVPMFSALRVLVSKLPCGRTSSWKIKIKYWEKLWIYSNMWVYIYIFKYWKNMEEHKDTCSSRNISSLWCSHDAWQKPWSITHVPSASMPTSCFHDWFNAFMHPTNLFKVRMRRTHPKETWFYPALYAFSSDDGSTQLYNRVMVKTCA